MPKNDDLKNRLDELFSTIPSAAVVEPEPYKAIEYETRESIPEIISLEESTFHTAFDNASVGMLLTTKEGDFLQVNDAFCEMFGFTRSELEGQNFQQLIYSKDLKVGAEAMRSMLSGRSVSAQFEKRYVREDGQIIWADLQISLIRDSEGNPLHFFTIAQDITKERQNSELLQNALSTLEIVLTGGERISHAQNSEEILQALVEFSPLGKYEQSMILLFDEPWLDVMPEFVRVEAWSGCVEPGEIFLPGAVFDLQDFPLTFLDLNGQPVVITNIEGDPRLEDGFRERLYDFGYSLVMLPIITEENRYGWLLATSSIPVELDDNEMREILIQVDRAATVIESKKLQQAMTDRLEELSSLQRLLSREAWSSFQRSEAASVIGYSFDRVEVRPITYQTISPDLLDPPIGKNGGLVVQGNRIHTPLALSGEPIGILEVEKDSNQQLTEEDDEFLRTISEQVAQALERARLMEQTQKNAIELQAVADVSTATAALLDPDVLLQNVVDLTKERFGLYHAHIYIFDEIENRLNLTAGAGEIGHQMVQSGWSIPIERETSIVARCARARTGQIVVDVEQELQFLQNPLLPLTRSEMAVPMVVGDRLLGVFDVQSENMGHFSDKDVRTFTTLAAQIGVALQNALLYAEQIEANSELVMMNQISGAVSHTLEIQQVLGEILEQVLEITEFDSGLISYVTKEDKKLRLAVHSNLPELMVNFLTEHGMDGTACDLVYQTGKSVHVPNMDNLPSEVLELESLLSETWPHQGVAPCFNGPRKVGFTSYVGVPLVSKRVEFGTVCVFNRTPKQIKPSRLAMLEAIGNQVGVAVENSMLYAEQLQTVERLRELDNMKSAFLANMSHELRTPLNSILGFTQVIIEGLDGPLTELMTSDLELIEKNGKHLLHLINDVLDLARIEAGRLSLSPEPTNIYNLLEDVMMINTSLVREKGLDMKLIADPDQDWTVMIDQVRMRQILINLLGNSVKFTDTGGIFIELDATIDESEAERLQVRIRDTGIGIPPDRLEEIFEAFSQIDTSTTRKAGGTGLGLPISRRLVEMHGGRLWSESQGIGKGSTFYLELPFIRE